MKRDNVIYIGRKPAMSYVMAVLATFNNQDTVEIKARGKSITTAVDVAEITRNRYMENLAKPYISIETEKIADGEQERNVSCITIKLQRGDAPPKAKPEKAEKVPEKTEKAQEKPVTKDLSEIKGVGKAITEKLISSGYDSVAKIAGADPATLAEKTGLSEKQASKIVDAAREI